MEEHAPADESASLRPVVCEQGPLSRPDGSASFCQGHTIIMSAIYGPSEVKIQKERDSGANVEVVYKPQLGSSGCAEKQLEHLVKTTCKSAIILTQYPRTNIAITLQETQNSGSAKFQLLSCCINSTSLALIDSGIAMKCLVAAVSCVIAEKSNEIIIDPNSNQEKLGRAQTTEIFLGKLFRHEENDVNFSVVHSFGKESRCAMCFAFDSREYNLVSSWTRGIYTQDEFLECLSVSRNASKKIFSFYREAVTRKFSKLS